mmetsp:Transcript_38282/g.61446  ORF Transcript_38282/g.61446 Transcript_38282/m.61446 type:complete len:255 (+) Transcript_38282:518-1282(+)
MLAGKSTTDAIRETVRLKRRGEDSTFDCAKKSFVAKVCRVLMKAANKALTKPRNSNSSSVTVLKVTPMMIGMSVTSMPGRVRFPRSRKDNNTVKTGEEALIVCVNDAGTLLKLKYVKIRESIRVTALGRQSGAAFFTLLKTDSSPEDVRDKTMPLRTTFTSNCSKTRNDGCLYWLIIVLLLIFDITAAEYHITMSTAVTRWSLFPFNAFAKRLRPLLIHTRRVEDFGSDKSTPFEGRSPIRRMFQKPQPLRPSV